MNTYFNIRYEFDRDTVHNTIARNISEHYRADYICVADGVILDIANRREDYLNVINGGMFSICDSSFVPLYIRWIYGERFGQYCGSQIFMDIVSSRRYRMIFLGTQQSTLDGLCHNLSEINPDVKSMQFVELPFASVEEFDYKSIAKMIEEDGADIIWIALGAPKQEYFMNRLKPYLKHGVMIAVGAAFKFFSGTDTSRAPEWMVRWHLEFVHRIIKEPRKQLKRCRNIVVTLPRLLYNEWKQSRNK